MPKFRYFFRITKLAGSDDWIESGPFVVIDANTAEEACLRMTEWFPMFKFWELNDCQAL